MTSAIKGRKPKLTPEQRMERWRLAGTNSPTNFRNDPDRAVEAGRAGGFVSNFRTQGHARAAAAARHHKESD